MSALRLVLATMRRNIQRWRRNIGGDVRRCGASPNNHVNVLSEKLTISQAHWKLSHISHTAIQHAVSQGLVTGIELDLNSKLDFCEPCAKAKSAWQPFPKESQTRATKYGKRVHWDLWGPASVRSLNGHYYVAARINDATRETMLYSQEKKSQTFSSYKRDKAFIKPSLEAY